MPELLAASALRRLQHPAVDRLVVAISGGVDSTALLHAVSQTVGQAVVNVRVQGLHIHHGLVANADLLAEAAQRSCDACQVPLATIAVEVAPGGSVEAAAREARYAAFSYFLVPGDLLLLAHHADDQVETALFRLFRGSRVAGLDGMPEERRVGQARLYRPLLQLTRQTIVEYARVNDLAWVEDESNADLSLDRNYIRHSALPIIEARWPEVRERLLSALERDGRARSILTKHQSEQLDAVRVQPDCLDLEALREQSETELVELLGAWLTELGVGMPGGKFLREVAGALTSYRLIDARSGQLEIRQNRDRLYALKSLPAAKLKQFLLSPGETSLSGGALNNDIVEGKGLCQGDYCVRFRQGGETLRQRHDRSLKNLCQESGLPAWLRPRLPLIYKDEELVAIAAVPGWGFPMQIADGYAVNGSEAGFDLALHLNDRL